MVTNITNVAKVKRGVLTLTGDMYVSTRLIADEILVEIDRESSNGYRFVSIMKSADLDAQIKQIMDSITEGQKYLRYCEYFKLVGDPTLTLSQLEMSMATEMTDSFNNLHAL